LKQNKSIKGVNLTLLLARLASPYMGMMAPMMQQQVMMTPTGQLVQAQNPIQVQYVQPPTNGGGAQYESRPISYGHAATNPMAVAQAAAQAVSHPPPPPHHHQEQQQQQHQHQSENSRSSTPHTKNTTEQHNGGGGENKDGYGDSVENDRLHAQIKELRSELDKSRRDNQKSRDKVKKLSRENHAATKSYTVRDGKCPFCQQEMPTKNRK